MGWTVEEAVEGEIATLSEDMRARLPRVAKLIEENDRERVGEPHVKHVEGRLWEMRLNGRSGMIFVKKAKKTEKTPRREIDLRPLTREIGSVTEVWQWLVSLICTTNG